MFYILFSKIYVSFSVDDACRLFGPNGKFDHFFSQQNGQVVPPPPVPPPRRPQLPSTTQTPIVLNGLIENQDSSNVVSDDVGSRQSFRTAMGNPCEFFVDSM